MSKKTTRSTAAKRAGGDEPEGQPPDDSAGFDLNYRQAAFVNEFLVDLNGTQAAIRAGYSKDSAAVIATENLRKPNIRAAIQKAMDQRAERNKITADAVLNELKKIGFADVRQIVTPGGHLRDLTAIDDNTAAAIQSVEVVTRADGDADDDGNRRVEHVHKIRLVDKKGPLELLGKHLRLFADKVEHSGPNGGPIETKEVGGRELARRIAFVLTKATKTK